MHRIFDSKLGNILVILYAVLTIVVPAFSLVCSSAWCVSLVIVPILPWVIVAHDLGFSVPFATYPLFVLLNVCALYLLSAGIESLYRASRERRLSGAGGELRPRVRTR